MEVKKSTRIEDLKKMKIFDGGRRKCPPHSFTLGDPNTGKKLEDDDTLGSIHPHPIHGVRHLNFYSCCYYIQFDEESRNTLQKAFFNDMFPLNCHWLDVIMKELGQRKNQRKNNQMVWPGGIVEYF